MPRSSSCASESSVPKKHSDERSNQRGRGDPDDQFERSMIKSAAKIQREFDEGYGRFGGRFAQGDSKLSPAPTHLWFLTTGGTVITENQLQAQVIYLQQTVIDVLQDALKNGTQPDMSKLIEAQKAARKSTVAALREQESRLGRNDISPPRALPPPKRASTITSSVIDAPSNPLFCRYAQDLQFMPSRPLARDFAPGGSCQCPSCFAAIDATADDFWKIGKCTPRIVADRGYEKEILETREFVLGQRFVIKCHTPDGKYACVLCNNFRNQDAICRTVEALVRHVGNYHDISEIIKDKDLREVDLERTRLALEAPRAPSPPVIRDFQEVRETVYR